MTVRPARRLLALCVALWLGATHAASTSMDQVNADLAARLDPRIGETLPRIHRDRRLLALRSYLRAGEGLTQRWSWTAEEMAAFAQSPENQAMQAEIERVREAFVAANPGYELWVNPELRSLDTQLANWNSNASVGRAAANLIDATWKWMSSREVRGMSEAQRREAVAQFLIDWVPDPVPTLAAPGLSPHGQARAVDFQIRRNGRTVAGPDSATIARAWEAAGWAKKLDAAVRAGSDRFTGPLQSPREPWHYTYGPVRASSQ